jgi:hypothetical protein
MVNDASCSFTDLLREIKLPVNINPSPSVNSRTPIGDLSYGGGGGGGDIIYIKATSKMREKTKIITETTVDAFGVFVRLKGES